MRRLTAGRALASWLGHFLWIQSGCELIFGQYLLFPAESSDRFSGLYAFFSDLGGTIVTDYRRQTGYERHTLLY
jgi:hypothetical protein